MGHRRRIRRVKTHNHDIQIYSFPWDCYKVREIAEDVYELFQADCNDPEAKRKSRTTLTLNVKKKGIYNVLVLPEKVVIKLAKEERKYNVTNLLFFPREVSDLQFDDANLTIRYAYLPGKRVVTTRIRLPKPVVFERDQRDHYSIIRLWKPEDYEFLKKEIMRKVKASAN